MAAAARGLPENELGSLGVMLPLSADPSSLLLVE